MNENNQKKFLTVSEVADLLRCDPKTVLRRIWTGKITATKPPQSGFWLIPVGEIHKYLEGGANQ